MATTAPTTSMMSRRPTVSSPDVLMQMVRPRLRREQEDISPQRRFFRPVKVRLWKNRPHSLDRPPDLPSHFPDQTQHYAPRVLRVASHSRLPAVCSQLIAHSS